MSAIDLNLSKLKQITTKLNYLVFENITNLGEKMNAKCVNEEKF